MQARHNLRGTHESAGHAGLHGCVSDAAHFWNVMQGSRMPQSRACITGPMQSSRMHACCLNSGSGFQCMPAASMCPSCHPSGIACGTGSCYNATDIITSSHSVAGHASRVAKKKPATATDAYNSGPDIPGWRAHGGHAAVSYAFHHASCTSHINSHPDDGKGHRNHLSLQAVIYSGYNIITTERKFPAITPT